jgi:uncharacterized protein (DUF488 family)
MYGGYHMSQDSTLECKTVGHSNYDIPFFVHLLQTHAVTCLIDVRSQPYSRHNPQFNRETLDKHLAENEIKYVFLGDKLGARYEDPAVLFDDNKVNFKKVRALPQFQAGIDQVIILLQEGYNAALMCAEKDPLKCHRFGLVSYALAKRGVHVDHIISPEEIKSQMELEQDLLAHYKKNGSQRRLDSFFSSPASRKNATPTSRDSSLEEAYELLNREIAYVAKSVAAVVE